MNVDNENECIDVICHRLSFHQLSCVAEDGSSFVCHSQFCQMNADVQSRRGRFVGGGEDGGEGERGEYAGETGEGGGDDDGDDNVDGVAHDMFAWGDDENDEGVAHDMFAWYDDDEDGDGGGGEGASGGEDSGASIDGE